GVGAVGDWRFCGARVLSVELKGGASLVAATAKCDRHAAGRQRVLGLQRADLCPCTLQRGEGVILGAPALGAAVVVAVVIVVAVVSSVVVAVAAVVAAVVAVVGIVALVSVVVFAGTIG